MKKLRNKLLSIFLSVCMLTGMLPIVAFAAGDAFSATSTNLKIGDSVTVRLTQPELVEGAGAVEAVFGFDKEVFEVINVSSASFSNASVVVTNVEEANNAGGAGISAAQVDNEMTVPVGMELLSLTLKVKDTAKAGETTFTLDSYEITRNESTTTDLTPIVNNSITVTIEVQEAEGPIDITDGMNVEFTNKKYPFGDRYGKVPETEVTVGNDTLVKDKDYTVEGAGDYKNNGGWPYVAGNENFKCVVLISPVEGSNYTFTAKEYSFVPESNEDSLTIAYKDGQSLSKDYDGEPVSIETNYSQFGTAKPDPLKVMTMTSARATTGGQFLYVDGTGYSNKVVWTYYTDEACTQKTTTEDNGAAAEGGAPVKAGNYWLQAYVAPDNAKIWTEATSNALPFTIRAVEEWNVTIESISDQTYTGEELTPEVTVKNSAGQTLTKDQDYTVSYKNNVNAGTAQVTVKAIEKSENSASKVATAEFKINPAELTAEGLVGTLKPVPYTGKARTPSTPSFTYKGKALTSGTDYTATRTSTEKPVNAGTYSYEWTVTGKGNYTGTANVSVNFVINKKDLSGNSKYPELYPFKNSMTYTGNPITQDQMKVYMTYTDAMVPDVDYTVSYTNNINVGTATITITPKAGGNVIFNEFTTTFAISDSYGIVPVIEKINNIGTVTLDSEEKISDARAAYDKLAEDAKQYISNYSILTAAEAKLKELKDGIDEVIVKISSIGEVTLDSESAIEEAREAYDALSEEQKEKVTNYDTLVAAEDTLKELQKNDNITCYVRAEGDDGTVLSLTKVTMNKHEIPSFSSYAIKNAPNDVDYVTPMHILLQALTDRGMTDELATVDIGSSGWINDIFGWGMDNLWCVNGIDPPYVSSVYQAKDGDVYTFYEAHGSWGAGNGYTGYGFFGEFGEGQNYTPKSAIETTAVSTEVGQPVELTYLFTSSMHIPQYGPCYDEDGGISLVYISENGAENVTDDDLREDITVDSEGKFSITFDHAGVYIVSARYYAADGSRNASNAYCKVTVNDTTAPIISEIENGKTYYGDTAFSVTELDLDKVTVDGNKVTPDKTTGKYVIPADNQEHTIVAVDKTGNQSECKIKVYKIYTVTFKADDTVLSTQQVGYGKDAELIPTSIIPAKTGYDEIAPKWDKDGKNITADTIITAVYTKNPVGEYTIETPKDNAGSAKLDTTNLKEIEKAVPLTGEEKIQVEQGKDVKLMLIVKDVTASVAADDKALVEAQLNGNTLGMYLDVTLFKQLGDAEVTKLTELNKNVVIKFIVPDNLINTNSSINRTYQVIRVHDGKAEVMKSNFDLATKTLSFETDQFSIYALSYSDTLKPVENKVDTEKDDANKDNTNKVTDNQGTTGKGNTGTTYSTTGKVVNTGDSSPIVLLILLMCLAGTVLTGCIYKKKRS